jgi:ribosomal protein S18 acetylase RimI-like enzyme
MVEIRAAVPSDAPAISAIASEVQALHAAAHPTIFKPASTTPFPPDTVAALMTTPGHLFWVAIMSELVAGYAYAVVQHQPETVWKFPRTVLLLEQMGVRAARRSQGAGSALLAEVRNAAAVRGVTEVRLTVWGFNEEARRFYTRRGFAVMQEIMSLWLPGSSGGVP